MSDKGGGREDYVKYGVEILGGWGTHISITKIRETFKNFAIFVGKLEMACHDHVMGLGSIEG